MDLIKPFRKLFMPSAAPVSGATAIVPAEGATPDRAANISRRKFFSFFGAGVAVMAAPGLFESQLLTRPLYVPASSPALWTKIGSVIRSYVTDNIQKADIEFCRGFHSPWTERVVLEGVPVFKARGAPHYGAPGTDVFMGPGQQLTLDPPPEDLWIASQKARGLAPDEILTFTTGKPSQVIEPAPDMPESVRRLIRRPEGFP